MGLSILYPWLDILRSPTGSTPCPPATTSDWCISLGDMHCGWAWLGWAWGNKQCKERSEALPAPSGYAAQRAANWRRCCLVSFSQAQKGHKVIALSLVRRGEREDLSACSLLSISSYRSRFTPSAAGPHTSGTFSVFHVMVFQPDLKVDLQQTSLSLKVIRWSKNPKIHRRLLSYSTSLKAFWEVS